MPWSRFLSVLAASLLILFSASSARATLTFEFDFSQDTSGFFTSHPQAAAVLDAAAAQFSSRLGDSLLAITPGSGNTWIAQPFDPSNPDNTLNLTDLSIAANTIRVYVGGASITSLGLGGPGGLQATGFGEWGNIVQGRGKPGATGPGASQTSFAPWGGSIAFNTTVTWYFDPDPSTNDVPTGQNDFYSVTLHELGHVLGFGAANSWFNQVTPEGNFTGPSSTLVNHGLEPELSPDEAHWFDGTMSVIMDTMTAQEAAMDPSLTVGTRKQFTLLDFAGVKDIGWQVAIPEPAAWPMAAFAAASLTLCLRCYRPSSSRMRRRNG